MRDGWGRHQVPLARLFAEHGLHERINLREAERIRLQACRQERARWMIMRPLSERRSLVGISEDGRFWRRDGQGGRHG